MGCRPRAPRRATSTPSPSTRSPAVRGGWCRPGSPPHTPPGRHLLRRQREPCPARSAPRRFTHPEEEVEGVEQAAQTLHRVLPGHGEPPQETAPSSQHILPPDAGPPAPCRGRHGEGPGNFPSPRNQSAGGGGAKRSPGVTLDRPRPGGNGRALRGPPQRPPVAHPRQPPFSSRPARRSRRY